MARKKLGRGGRVPVRVSPNRKRYGLSTNQEKVVGGEEVGKMSKESGGGRVSHCIPYIMTIPRNGFVSYHILAIVDGDS